jgi:hypothetical protein
MPANVPPADEDDGSIPLAGDLAIGTGRNGAVVDSQIGDGPHGRPDGDGSNDFDFFKVTARPGQVLIATAATPNGPLDTELELWSAAGTLLAIDDDNGLTLDSQITFPVTTAGDYYISVAAFGGLPRPRRSSSTSTAPASTPASSAAPASATFRRSPQQGRPRPVGEAERQPHHRRRHGRRVRRGHDRHLPEHRPRQLRDVGDRPGPCSTT